MPESSTSCECVCICVYVGMHVLIASVCVCMCVFSVCLWCMFMYCVYACVYLCMFCLVYFIARQPLTDYLKLKYDYDKEYIFNAPMKTVFSCILFYFNRNFFCTI